MATSARRSTVVLVAASLVTMVAATALVFAPARADDVSSGTQYVCRAITTGETPNAQMMAGAPRLICRPVNIVLKMSRGSLRTIGSATANTTASGPDISKALTPQQINDAYVKFIEQTFHIDHTS
jgi:hypothetical protein